jgi:hypothetical protein
LIADTTHEITAVLLAARLAPRGIPKPRDELLTRHWITSSAVASLEDDAQYLLVIIGRTPQGTAALRRPAVGARQKSLQQAGSPAK